VIRVLWDLIDDGDGLFRRTNSAIEMGLVLTPVAQQTVMLGARGLNALYAVRVLAEYNVDDQIAVIARSIVEAAIDVEYLNETTRRTRGGREVELTSEAKAELFATHKPIVAFNTISSAEELGPDDPLPDDLAAEFPTGYWDELRRAKDEALRLRSELGLNTKSPYWSCAGNWNQVAELRHALPAQAGRYRQHRRAFENFSFFTHANPNDAPYVVRETGKLRTAFRLNSVIDGAIVSALELFRWWGAVLGEELRPRFLEYLRRLREEWDA
jgi:hypothetical protein